MKANRKELISKLEGVLPGIASDQLLPQAEYFTFTDKYIYSFDGSIAISCPFESGIYGTVKAKEFLELLKKMDDEMLSIEMSDNVTEIVIKGNTIESGFVTGGMAEEPLVDIEGLKDWIPLSDDFVAAISFCLFSVAKDQMQGALSNLLVKDNAVISCDHARLTKYSIENDMGDGFLLPWETVEKLCKYNFKEYTYQEERGWCHFRSDEGIVFSCYTVSAEYPETRYLFDVEGELVFLPEELGKVLERVTVIVDKSSGIRDEHVEIEIGKGKIVCYGQGVYGWVKEKIKTDYKGQDLNLLINPAFLREILKYTKEVRIGKGSLLFHTDIFDHVLALRAGK